MKFNGTKFSLVVGGVVALRSWPSAGGTVVQWPLKPPKSLKMAGAEPDEVWDVCWRNCDMANRCEQQRVS